MAEEKKQMNVAEQEIDLLNTEENNKTTNFHIDEYALKESKEQEKKFFEMLETVTKQDIFSVNIQNPEPHPMLKTDLRWKVRMACAKSGITLTELAVKMGMSQQSLTNRLKTGKFKIEEYDKMAEQLGCKYFSYFEYEDGTKI